MSNFSDALIVAISDDWERHKTEWVDIRYEYDLFDDFTRKTSRVVAISAEFIDAQSPKTVGTLLQMMRRALLRADACPERLFYRDEPIEGKPGFYLLTCWGMKELPAESVELQEVS